MLRVVSGDIRGAEQDRCTSDWESASGGLGTVHHHHREHAITGIIGAGDGVVQDRATDCLLYTSDAADERSRVDLGGRRIIHKQKN